jgi:hypothetical protein
MRKMLVFAPFLIAAIAAFACTDSGSVPTASEPAAEAPAVESLPFLADAIPASALQCTYKCIDCLPPNAPACEWLCVYIGKCESRCTGFEVCSSGFEWNENACRCLPDRTPFED